MLFKNGLTKKKINLTIRVQYYLPLLWMNVVITTILPELLSLERFLSTNLSCIAIHYYTANFRRNLLCLKQKMAKSLYAH